MKMLINKSNPQIRITAPEIEALYDKCHRVEYYYIKDLRLGLLQDNWTLVEEETEMDLEEAAKEYIEHHKLETASITKLSMYRSLAFKEGAKWMAKQIKGGSK